MTSLEAIAKSLIWRFLIAIPLGMAVAYYYVDDVTVALEITIAANVSSTILYYLFDIFWFNKATKLFDKKEDKHEKT